MGWFTLSSTPETRGRQDGINVRKTHSLTKHTILDGWMLEQLAEEWDHKDWYAYRHATEKESSEYRKQFLIGYIEQS